MSAHQEISQALAGLYRSADPHSVLPMMTAYADELLDLLDAPMNDSHRTALNTATVGAHAQAGLWACHMHRPSLAYRYLATSREIAAATGDPSLHACSLGALSYLFSSAPRGGQDGNPQHCLELLDEALGLACRSDPFTRGWLFALAGDAQLSLRTFDEVQVSAANMRRRIATYGHQALVQANRRDPEAACTALSSSIRLATQEHYTMGFERAIGVRHRFDVSWSTLPAVRDLDDQIRHLSVL